MYAHKIILFGQVVVEKLTKDDKGNIFIISSSNFGLMNGIAIIFNTYWSIYIFCVFGYVL
jgi:hypothetical protein